MLLDADTAGTMWLQDGVMITRVHALDCPDYLAEQARLMGSAERVRQEEERAQQLSRTRARVSGIEERGDSH
ncbi:hypothetical protein ACU635_60770 [[Actinomadura] parvosata]|uniref:hypothetical protein n=1 Tax=[Actinomadura] parvosata TaxID=1955412 RepID=UPI00406C1AA5